MAKVYLTSISQVFTSQYLSAWTIGVGYMYTTTERVIVLSKILALSNSLALLLAVISRQHGSNQTLPVKEHVLLANIKRHCWTLQVVEWGDVLVYTNNVLQCLHPIAYKARYVQKCRVMRFMLFMISIKKNPIFYSL